MVEKQKPGSDAADMFLEGGKGPAQAQIRRAVEQLGTLRFQPEIDAKINGLGGNAGKHWKNHGRELTEMALGGKDYRAWICEKNFFPIATRNELIAVCEIVELAARMGKTTVALAEGDKQTASGAGKHFNENQQQDIIRIAVVGRAFAEEYAAKKGMTTGKAWGELMKDDAFIAMLASYGTPGYETNEANARKKYGLTEDPKIKQEYSDKAGTFVAGQAQKAGFSDSAIRSVSRELGFPLPGTLGMPVPAALQAQQAALIAALNTFREIIFSLEEIEKERARKDIKKAGQQEGPVKAGAEDKEPLEKLAEKNKKNDELFEKSLKDAAEVSAKAAGVMLSPGVVKGTAKEFDAATPPSSGGATALKTPGSAKKMGEQVLMEEKAAGTRVQDPELKTPLRPANGTARLQAAVQRLEKSAGKDAARDIVAEAGRLVGKPDNKPEDFKTITSQLADALGNVLKKPGPAPKPAST